MKHNNDDGHTIWLYGEEIKHEDGVAFVVRNGISDSVITCCTSILNSLA